MNYLRSLFLNFLVVFFVDRISPGVEIIYFEQIPDIGADILFSILVGFLNASIFPFLMILELNPSKTKMAIMSLCVSYGAFIVISMIPFGIQVTSPAGVLVGGTLVWAVAYFTNYLEYKHYSRMNQP
ncbi:MAG: hypothetical protein JSS32_04245 [Verrucomicrobia bacterium]|nr:hypothetical protein [Verrucomicrobiota bacterium]